MVISREKKKEGWREMDGERGMERERDWGERDWGESDEERGMMKEE